LRVLLCLSAVCPVELKSSSRSTFASLRPDKCLVGPYTCIRTVGLALGSRAPWDDEKCRATRKVYHMQGSGFDGQSSRGQSLLEYSLIMLFVVLVVVGALVLFAPAIGSIFAHVPAALSLRA